MLKRNRVVIVLTIMLLISGVGAWIITTRPDDKKSVIYPDEVGDSSYSIQTVGSQGYRPNIPAEFKFKIVNETGKTIRDFDLTHEKPMHLIVLRKDRTNFQHVHPEFSASDGVFTLSNLLFPTEGEYRLYIDFTSATSQIGPEGIKLRTTLHRDLTVGDVSKYQQQPVGATKLRSSDGGITTTLFEVPNDGAANLGYTAATTNTLAFDVTKGGQNYQDFEEYLGTRGQLIAIGPDLEYIQTQSVSDSMTKSYIIGFNVNFPKGGTYKLFLQIQDQGVVRTTDFTVDVQPNEQPAGN